MKYEFTSLEEHQLLLVLTEGNYSTTANTDFLEAMYSAYAEHSCNKILIDYRKANINIDVAIALERPATYDSLVGAERPRKVALVFAAMNIKYRFFEDVCQNRGWNLQTYDDYDSALDWLTRD